MTDCAISSTFAVFIQACALAIALVHFCAVAAFLSSQLFLAKNEVYSTRPTSLPIDVMT